LLGGNISKPTYKTDLQETAGAAINNLKDQAATLVKNKVDTAKAALKDTLQHVKNQAIASVKDELTKQLTGKKDSSTNKSQPLQDVGKQAGQAVKNTLGGFFKKKNTTDTTKH